ncbi:hypothetical protein INR49_016396, partial [Caranx melampygus]
SGRRGRPGENEVLLTSVSPWDARRARTPWFFNPPEAKDGASLTGNGRGGVEQGERRSFPQEGWSETEPGDQEQSESWSPLRAEKLEELRLDEKGGAGQRCREQTGSE